MRSVNAGMVGKSAENLDNSYYGRRLQSGFKENSFTPLKSKQHNAPSNKLVVPQFKASTTKLEGITSSSASNQRPTLQILPPQSNNKINSGNLLITNMSGSGGGGGRPTNSLASTAPASTMRLISDMNTDSMVRARSANSAGKNVRFSEVLVSFEKSVTIPVETSKQPGGGADGKDKDGQSGAAFSTTDSTQSDPRKVRGVLKKVKIYM